VKSGERWPDDNEKLLARATSYAAEVMKSPAPDGSDQWVGAYAVASEWADAAIASAFVIGYNAALADMPRGRR